MIEFSRSALLLGDEAIETLQQAHVAVFGVGGVGQITLVDDDEVSLSNINRQFVALHSTVGQKKAEVMKARILDINNGVSVVLARKLCGRDG